MNYKLVDEDGHEYKIGDKVMVRQDEWPYTKALILTKLQPPEYPGGRGFVGLDGCPLFNADSFGLRYVEVK